METKVKVLVVGESGYLGQHLLESIAEERRSATGGVEGGMTKDWDLAFTQHRPDPPPKLVEAISPVIPFYVDLNTSEGLDAISIKFGQPHVVVNCAAISVPRVCEEKPADAMAINVPSAHVNWLSSFAAGDSTLLVHLSTDQDKRQMQSVLNIGGPSKLELDCKLLRLLHLLENMMLP